MNLTPDRLTSTGGTNYVSIAAATAADTVCKSFPGRLCRVIVIATGTNPLQIFDNASAGSGTVIAGLPASPAIGTVLDLQVPATLGITVKGNAANPGVVVTFY